MKQFVYISCVFLILVVLLHEISSTPVRVRRQGWTWEEPQEPQRPTPGPFLSTTRRRPQRPTGGQRPMTSTSTISPNSNSGTTSTTTASPEFRRCFAACPTTSQYNPVCGTNRVTYDNDNKLSCAKRCGLDVDVLFRGTCEPL